MMFQRSSMRYAHTTGYTNLIYTKNDGEIITCGSDGDIRRWTGIDDDDPTSTCLGEFVVCITQDENGRLLASTDRNTVQAYTLPGIDKDGTLLRFTASVTCMCVNEKYLVAGSEDTVMKILKKTSEDQSVMELTGHTGPLLSLDISCKNLLASIAGDGQLKIWKLDDENATELKTITGLPKVTTFEMAKFFGCPSFEPKNGNSLAYAKGREIIVLSTSTWEVQFVLSDENVNSNYTCCRYSCDGLLIAAGTTSGELSVFDVQRKQSIKTEAPSSDCQAITCLVWNPKNKNELSYCDAYGQLGTLFASGGTNTSIKPVTEEEQVDFGDIEFEQDNESESRQNFGNDNDNEDDDDDGVSIEKLKSEIMGRVISGNGNVDDDDSKDSYPKSLHEPEETAARTLIPKLFKQQLPFQPSASPLNLEHRYMVWNEVGIVTAHADNSDGGSIEVDFHDVSVHHSLHLSNYNNHNMASLSSTVLALSGEGATKLVCIALAASGNKEWSVQFPDCESAEALVATRKLVAVATSMQFLRLFTVMGTQREVISLPGPVVCMAGSEHRILVCYHASAASEKQQHLGAMLIQTSGMTLRTQQIPFPLPPGRRVTWMGFSDCGSPTFCDSMGLLQLYSIKSNCWYPICDTMKHSQSVSNNYFIISVVEKSQIVQAVLCRASAYPMTNPRPMLQELPMNLPLCDAETEKTDLEDKLIRASIMCMENSDRTTKETAIKLFAHACRSEVEMRAKELIESIACPDILLLAVKYATKLGRIHLSDRLSELMPQLEEQNEREKQELQDFQLNQLIPFSPLMQRMLMFGCGVTSTSNYNSPAARLAPKPMGLSATKRAALKRFSSAQEKSTTSNTFDNTESSEILIPESNENMTESSIDKSPNLLLTGESKADTQESEGVKRSPFNSLNPFASKRKLADVGDTILNPSKFKFAKK